MVDLEDQLDGIPSKVCAAKTADPQQKNLFDEDLKFFANLYNNLKWPLWLLGKFDGQAAQEAGAAVNKITDMAKNGDLVKSIQGGFDMQRELDNTHKGKDLLCRLSDGRFFAPDVYIASETQDVLLMQLIEGEPIEKGLSDPQLFVKHLIGLYVAMVAAGQIHQDLHPSNIYITPDNSYAVLDWGEVVCIPEKHQPDALVLFKSVVAGQWMGHNGDTLVSLLTRVGVKIKPGEKTSNDNYWAVANMLNIVQGLRGDSSEANRTLVKATALVSPGWLEGWQKATNAIVITLQAVQTTPDMADRLMRAELSM